MLVQASLHSQSDVKMKEENSTSSWGWFGCHVQQCQLHVELYIGQSNQSDVNKAIVFKIKKICSAANFTLY